MALINFMINFCVLEIVVLDIITLLMVCLCIANMYCNISWYVWYFLFTSIWKYMLEILLIFLNLSCSFCFILLLCFPIEMVPEIMFIISYNPLQYLYKLKCIDIWADYSFKVCISFSCCFYNSCICGRAY